MKICGDGSKKKKYTRFFKEIEVGRIFSDLDVPDFADLVLTLHLSR